jgi:hypothetical protein
MKPTFELLIGRLGQLVAEEHDYTCLRCYNVVRKGFHIHHNHYKRLGNEQLKDLGFYCHRCHAILHKSRKDKRAFNSQYYGLIASKMCKFNEEELHEVLDLINKIANRN